MPSGAAQLPSHRGGRCRHCGAVMDCPAPQTLQPERGSGRPAGGRRRRGRPGCPDAGHGGRRWVRVRCSPCGRTSVQLVGRMSGVQATGVHATGVIRGVRTDTRPVSTAAAAALSGPCWIPESVGAAGPATLAHRVGRVAVVGARLGRRCPNRAWREGMVERWPCVARTRVDARPGLPLGMRTGCGAALAARRPWELAQRRCRSVGGGAGEGAGAPSPPQVRPGQVAGVLADHGAGPGGGDHAAWSVRWCWSPVVPRWRPHPAQRGAACGRSAAAVCEERCPLGADRALTSENSGGRDRV
jgi:hypothetical protein